MSRVFEFFATIHFLIFSCLLVLSSNYFSSLLILKYLQPAVLEYLVVQPSSSYGTKSGFALSYIFIFGDRFKPLIYFLLLKKYVRDVKYISHFSILRIRNSSSPSFLIKLSITFSSIGSRRGSRTSGVVVFFETLILL